MSSQDQQVREEMSPDEVMRTIIQAVRTRGVRWTNQREVIIAAFIAADRHLTAEELHDIVRAKDGSISAATVYRTLNLLVDCGMAAKRHFQEGSASFDLVLGKGHHHHLIDVDSGRIIEFNDDDIEVMLDAIAKRFGYRIACHKIELFGVSLEKGRSELHRGRR